VNDTPLWRVGHVTGPLEFLPWDLFRASQRFDDPDRRFRTIYCAEREETALREVLADFRPNLEEIQAFLSTFDEDERGDLPDAPVTAAWRIGHVLAPTTAHLEGPVIDLLNPEVRRDLEKRHAAHLTAHDLKHLDLHEITTRRRAITQAIAADVYQRLRAAAIRFPSSLDGNPCLAIFEGHSHLVAAGEPIPLTDPPPDALVRVCDEWELKREDA